RRAARASHASRCSCAFSRSFAASGVIPVRDSKNPNRPALVFSADGWSSFVSAVIRGEFPV
ncbi:DUF397 domain-containing protein, partial [Streptomyces sp. MCAF7]